jgi:hypothetical protein
MVQMMVTRLCMSLANQEVLAGQCKTGGKERVSFGTNISSDEVMSNGTSVQQEAKLWSDAVERFHARKFRDKHLPNSDKQATIHKVAGTGSIKK